MFTFINFPTVQVLKQFLLQHYVMTGTIIISGIFMCYSLTQVSIKIRFIQPVMRTILFQSAVVIYDMWMNYDDFTRTKRTNAISQVNGIASEYVRRLDDEPSKKLYDGRTRFQLLFRIMMSQRPIVINWNLAK